MTLKSANVVARVEPEIKQQAEDILQQIGVSSSSVINALYKQIIIQQGIPFPMVAFKMPLPETANTEKINALLTEGLRQAKAGEGGKIDTIFSHIRRSHNL